MTRDEAAAYLRVSLRTLDRWVQERKLRVYRLEAGRRRRFKREDLDRLLTEEAHPPED